jgi:predicted dehydrogenase
MLGEFASVSAALPIVSARKDVAEDSYVIRFQMANGVEGVLQQTAAAWGPGASMTSVAGTDGTVWIDGGTVKVADRNGTRDLPIPADLILPEPVQFAPYTRLCEALRAVMEGRAAASAVPIPTFVDGVACMEVLDAIRRSAANKGELVTLR